MKLHFVEKLNFALIGSAIFLTLIGCSEPKKATGVVIRTEKNLNSYNEIAVVVKLKDGSLISRTFYSHEMKLLCAPGTYVRVNYRDASIIDFESFSEVPYDDRPSIYSK